MSVVLLFLFAATGQCAAQSATYLGVLYADDGKYSGHSEAEHILQALQNQTALALADCVEAATGFLPGAGGSSVPAIVVATGIGALNAALCTRSVLAYAPITTIFWTGTAGQGTFTAGGLNPMRHGGCSPPSLSTHTVQPVGSVCITASATDMTCGLCVHSNSPDSLNECSRPNCKLHDAVSMFGPCTFTAQRRLSDEVFAFATSIALPAPPAVLIDSSVAYWSATGYAVEPSMFAAPAVRNNCIETDFRQILASGPMDYLGREYTAEVLNDLGGAFWDADNVTTFVAMEGIGFLQALTHRPDLPVVIVRGGANYDSYPLVFSGDTWSQNTTYVSESAHSRLVLAGYAYSILTTNTIVLAYIAAKVAAN